MRIEIEISEELVPEFEALAKKQMLGPQTTAAVLLRSAILRLREEDEE